MIYYNPITKSYVSSLLNDVSITSGFTTREAGDGRNPETILSYLRINQVIFTKLVIAEQIHSSNVLYFQSSQKKDIEKIDEVDGIYTLEKGVALGVRTADCIPVLYADIENGVIGVSHNGWRGTLKKISLRIIDEMVSKGAEKKNIIVVLGPGIGTCCYDIEEERYYSFMEEYENDFGAFPIRGGKRHFNLLKFNFELLRLAGIQSHHIDFFPFCTMCNKEHFFSYRRDYKKHREKFGEMLSFIVKN